MDSEKKLCLVEIAREELIENWKKYKDITIHAIHLMEKGSSKGLTISGKIKEWDGECCIFADGIKSLKEFPQSYKFFIKQEYKNISDNF